MRTIAAVTVARSDWGIYQPVLRAIRDRQDLSLRILVSSAHLAPEFGYTVTQIEQEFPIAERIPTLLSSDTPGSVARSTALGVIGFAQAFERERPDLLLVLGDRFDMFAAALAALPFNIPVAHIHGGELSEGAIDDALRHSMTKLSHLHFVTTETYAGRVRQLGEESWRVVVSGAPALDHLREMKTLTRDELQQRFGVQLDPAPLLVTFHPVTLEISDVLAQTRELLDAVADVGLPVLFTLPNADTNGRAVIAEIDRFVADQRVPAQIVTNFGTEGYFSLLRVVPAMVGNSSSGLIEAGSFGLPVVNVGNRQRGRVRGANVIDVGNERAAIAAAIRRAISPEFRRSIRDEANPYDAQRPAGELIAARLAEVSLERLISKRFVDL